MARTMYEKTAYLLYFSEMVCLMYRNDERRFRMAFPSDVWNAAGKTVTLFPSEKENAPLESNIHELGVLHKIEIFGN